MLIICSKCLREQKEKERERERESERERVRSRNERLLTITTICNTFSCLYVSVVF